MTVKVEEKRGLNDVNFEQNPLIDSLLANSIDEDECSAIERVLLRCVLRARRISAPMSVLVLSFTDGAKPKLSRMQMRKLLVGVGESIRHTDSCGPVNDRDILIVLPGSGEAGARIAAERVARNGQLRRLVTEGYGLHFSVSDLQGDETTLATLIDRARANENKVRPSALKARRRH